MTPEEALQHEWIKEAWGSRRDRMGRTHHKRSSTSPASSDSHHHHHHHALHHALHHHNHHNTNNQAQPHPQNTTDPYKVPAQPPNRGTWLPLNPKTEVNCSFSIPRGKLIPLNPQR